MFMRQDRWEVGSEYDWHDGLGDPPLTEPWFPKGFGLFSCARAALLTLANVLRPDGPPPVLHLPSFSCMETARRLACGYVIRWYRDIPAESGPDFATLRAAPGDAVLAANTFGVRSPETWRRWSEDHRAIVLIEDHTHDPYSRWAQSSESHYAVVSLRKTLPVPDGAMLWSPRGLPLPRPSAPVVHDRVAAMVLKAAYLRGGAVAKERFRELQTRGEQVLEAATDSAASPFTAAILPSLDVMTLRQRRAANVQHLFNLLGATPTALWQPLSTTWPDGAAPFNAVISCKDMAVRDSLRRFLLARHIYCPVHWPQSDDGFSSGDPLAIALSRRVLTVPVDHRYSSADVERVAATLLDFDLHQRKLCPDPLHGSRSM